MNSADDSKGQHHRVPKRKKKQNGQDT